MKFLNKTHLSGDLEVKKSLPRIKVEDPSGGTVGIDLARTAPGYHSWKIDNEGGALSIKKNTGDSTAFAEKIKMPSGEDELYVGGTKLSKVTHNHDSVYSKLGHNHSGTYEPVFTKNSAFNKNFGTGNTDVSRGDHNHNALYPPIMGKTGASDTWQVGNVAYNLCRCMIANTTKEIVIKTKIPFASGRHMPVIHLTGYAYGLNSPIELKIGYYVYSGAHGYCGVVSMGAWRPAVKLFSYTENGQKYTAIGLIGDIYFPQFSVNCQIEHGTITGDKNGWSIAYLAKDATSPTTIIGTDDVFNVPYKATFSATINGVAFNGINNISLTPANIGAATSGHNHSGVYEPVFTKNSAFNKNFAGSGSATTVSRSDHNHSGVYEPANSNIQTHVTSAHAPSSAQKNSDITKAEIEAKLTGAITTHTHAYRPDSWLPPNDHSHSNKATIDKITEAKLTNWDAGYTHSTVAHAPSNAQRNADITKAEIEAQLTGDIGTHTHSIYEPVFSKNSAFNKSFGGSGTATTVSRSDHGHTVVDSAYKMAQKDLRSTNENPQWYMTNNGKGVVYEFKNTSTIGLKTAFSEVPTYAEVSTYVSWGDSSGGLPVQLATCNTGMYFRTASSTTAWNSWKKITTSDHTHNYEPANSNIQAHITSGHAPSDAQKNSNITKAEIEAKLTGAITTHTHAYEPSNSNIQAHIGNGALHISTGAQTWSGLKTFGSGATFMGTALAAGLKTRGICGTAEDGTTKDHLYLNFDGDNVYTRKVYLGGTSDGAIAVRKDMLPTNVSQLTNDSGYTTATGHNHASLYEPKNTNIQAHVTAAHAPSTAQKNSDITKAEIEAKLTGAITTHTHNYSAPHSHPYLNTGGGTVTGFITLHSNPTANLHAVTKQYVDERVGGVISASDAMVFKGTLGTGGTVTALPTANYNTGWTYRVITAGTYAGVKCEIGDMIIAMQTRAASGAANSDWTVVQTNIDGAVTGPASAVTNRIVTFDGTSGKLIKDSGYTIATSVPSGAVFTDTKPGTLNTNNTSALSVSSSESLTGAISLHKVSKTGNYNDLLNKPTIGGLGGVSTTGTVVADRVVAYSGTTGQVIKDSGFTIAKSVPSDAVFTDTNTWRPVQDNLTSTATGDSLSANQGKVLKELVDGKVAPTGTIVANRVAVFNDTTGKVIKDSGYTIAKSVPSNAVFTDTTYGVATSSANGLMPSSDKAKLDSIGGVITATKSLTLTTAWQNYGINGTDLATGSYIVQITPTDSAITSQWNEYYTGTMSWYSGGTNSSETDEIILHKAGHAPNNSHIFLRIKRNANGVANLQIALNKTLTTATNVIIKFRKLI